jgi:hypothetical protein
MNTIEKTSKASKATKLAPVTVTVTDQRMLRKLHKATAPTGWKPERFANMLLNTGIHRAGDFTDLQTTTSKASTTKRKATKTTIQTLPYWTCGTAVAVGKLVEAVCESSSNTAFLDDHLTDAQTRELTAFAAEAGFDNVPDYLRDFLRLAMAALSAKSRA